MLNKMTGALAALVAMGLVSAMPAMSPVEEVAPAAEPAAAEAPPEAPAQEEAEDATPIVATVDGVAIHLSEVNRLVEPQMARFQGMDPDSQQMYKEMLEENALETLIARTLLINWAKKNEIKVTDEELDERMEELAESVGGSEVLDQVMAANNITLDSLKVDVRQSILMDKVHTRLTDAYQPSDEEIDELMAEAGDELEEEIAASHILVQVEADASDEDKAAARAKIDAILAEVREGADFAELAKNHSDCPSGARGGDLGNFNRGQMVPPFEEAAFSAEIGKVTDVVETQFGYHIINVSKRLVARDIAIESLKEEHFGKWLEAQKDSAKIEMGQPQS